MHAPVSTCDKDTFKHFQTRQAAWNIERRHLQLQMERLRQEKLAKAKAKKADTAAKAKKLASDWERKDALVNQHAVVQNAIGASEQGARHEERRLREMEEKLKRENEVAAHLANREAMEALSAANDAEIVRCGAEAWSRGMQVGAEEFALERIEYAKAQKAAVRDFGWSKADERLQEDVRRTTSKQLPTGPGALNHRQTPATWRADQLSMSPAAWGSHPINATVERAKTAQMRAHGKHMRGLEQRRGHVTAVMENWADLGVRVSDTHYKAWRVKVDAVHSPRTPVWPDKSTHRIRPSSIPPSPASTPRRSPRLGF